MFSRDIDAVHSDRIVIRAGQQALDDLRYRLRNTRWPDEYANDAWAYGTNRAYLQELVRYWADGFDWRSQETWLNTFEHHRTAIDGLNIHYVHARSADPKAIPVLLLHGWPGTFVQMLKLVPLLTAPTTHDMPGAPSFHVVVASLPGFGLSDAATAPGMGMEGIAALMHKLMVDVLGYARYGARGSDLGGTTIDQLGRHYPDELLGAHLTQIIVAGAPPAPPENATQAERDFLAASVAVSNGEIAYARIHSTKPQTLAYGLNDSPAGLAAWIVEKYRSWGDTGGDVESRFDRDFLLTTLTTYWLTQTIAPSIRTYYEMVRNRGDASRVAVPVAFLMSEKDMFPPAPREWAERSHNVVHFNTAPRGGHFLEWEEPELVARDMQEFFASLSPDLTAGASR
ncbi:MAG TPA: epoxide hydrolase [Pseudomonadales bacterium]